MVGLAGFIHDADPNEASITLDRMGEVLAEHPKVQLSQRYCDDHISCISASLPFTGLQPYIAADLAVWLDGEIYDFGALVGKINVTENVTVTVAALYRRHGLEFFKTTDGVFAAVIYDRERMELNLVTDRYGLRRLYVWKGRNLVWASALRTFLVLPEFVPKVDLKSLMDFMDLGYITEEKTWFSDVTLLPSGSVLTWDIQANNGKETRYWWWDEIKLLGGCVDEDEIADELGDLFIRAVQKRMRPGERIGSELSGGLDSRAIVAAISRSARNVPTLTVGKDGCADRVIAGQAAAAAGIVNRQFSLTESNWLLPRFRGVWLTDGQSDLQHMHCIEATELYAKLFDICLSGFAGDLVLGGGFLFEDALDGPISPELAARSTGQDPGKIKISEQYIPLSKTDFFILQNRVRRSTYNGIIMMADDIEMRMPFYDNRLLEFSYSLPDSVRVHSHIYKKMLLRRFPEFYRRIPWQKTGFPIGISDNLANFLHLTRRARRKLSRLSGGLFRDPLSHRNYTDYPSWLRQEPSCTVFSALLNSPKAIYPEYLPKSEVQSAWNQHLRGADHADKVFKYATFEIWLQQVFEKTLRTEADVQDFVQNKKAKRTERGRLDVPDPDVGALNIPHAR
jgi:asparagine synthase (glutamine-hydrolysing)